MNKTFSTFISMLQKNVNYIYIPQGNPSELIKLLKTEDIDCVNVNGYLLINEKDFEKVKYLNKEILEEKSNECKNIFTDELQDKLDTIGSGSVELCVFNYVSPYKNGLLENSLQNVPNLLLLTNENTNEISVQQNKIFNKGKSSVAQSVLAAIIKEKITGIKNCAASFEMETKANNYINKNKTASNDYFITSEIDPSVFMVVKKDGFTFNHWQATKDGTKRVVESKGLVSNDNYMESFYEAINRFPDIKIFNTIDELNKHIIKKQKNSISIRNLKKERCSKLLARQLNKMILDNNPGHNLNSYIAEASMILKATRDGLTLQNYDSKNIEKIKQIITRYGITDELTDIENIQPPRHHTETLTPETSISRKEGKEHANTDREGTV